MLRPKLNLVIQDPSSGRARPGAWVSIYLANTFALAPCYADDDVTTIGNPIQANALGQVAVRVPIGLYDVSATYDGTTPVTIEDVVAWTPDDTTVQEPGEIIVGGPDGAPATLPPGDPGQVLGVLPGTPPQVGWVTMAPGQGLPASAQGGLLHYPATDTLAPLPIGAAGQILVVNAGLPTWGTPAGVGIVIPINQAGDLMVGDAAGAPVRLGRGATSQVLTTLASGLLGWGPAGAASIITTLGDLIVGDPSGVPVRLPRGTDGQTLRTSSGGFLEWVTPTVERTLHFDKDIVMSNQTTAEQTLKNYVAPPNTPPLNSDRLRVRARGNMYTDGSTKKVRLYYGPTLLVELSTAANGSYWAMEVEILRIAVTSQRSNAVILVDRQYPEVSNVVMAVDMAVSQSIRLAVVTANQPNRVTIQQFEVRWLPA